MAKAVLTKLYQILKPGGEIIIGNFHVSNPSRIFMEYWLDWVLYYRTESEFLELVNPEWNTESAVTFENTRAQMFLHIKKLETNLDWVYKHGNILIVKNNE